MNYLEKAQLWKDYANLDSKLRKELDQLTDDQLKEVFTNDLTFGTGGLRGILGVGTDRMNYYIVRKATLGFGRYLATLPNALKKGVVIAHDNRHYSPEFALESAQVLSTMGFKVYLFSSLRPTPELSFAVRHFAAIGGIMITASHNPKEYNGYKIYDSDGCQLVPELANKVIDNINAIDNYFEIPTDKNHELITYIDKEVDDAYRSMVDTIRINKQLPVNFKVVYTPLHGTGQVFAADVLKSNGFDCHPVASQMTNDPDFSGVACSNPEDKRAFNEAIQLGKEIGAKLVLATDPDADRLGFGVYKNGEYQLFDGNQSATVIIHYICEQLSKQGRLPKDGYVFTTNVSSDLPLKIAQKYHLSTGVSLTGFKFIGQQAKRIEGNGSYVFGFEESYGCLIKDFVRDKDAIQAILMICEIEAYCESIGMDIVDYLEAIYREYGYSFQSQTSISLSGLDGLAKIQKVMQWFRMNDFDFKFAHLIRKEDNYLQINYDYQAKRILTSTNELPKANVLKYILDNGAWFVLRPSGTEPKLKVYFSTNGQTMAKAQTANQRLKEEIIAMVNKIIK